MSETVAVPFQTFRGRRYLADEQIEANPWLKDFIARWPQNFERDVYGLLWWFHPDAKVPWMTPDDARELADANPKANP